MPKPKMKKLFTGRGKTRPIPTIVDSSEKLAIKVAAASQKPKPNAQKFPAGPRVSGVSEVFGSKISGGSSAASKGGVYNPSTGLSETI